MDIKEFIGNAVEDLITLEVATITNATDQFTLTTKLTDAQKKKLKEYEDKVDAARTALISEIDKDVPNEKKKDKRQRIRGAKDVLKEAEKQLSEVQKGLGVNDPKDIFGTIRTKLTDGNLVAYSRYELEGDSINFVNSNPAVQELTQLHKEMVASSQEARKALFQSAVSLFRK